MAGAHRNEIVSCDLLYIPVEMRVSNISSALVVLVKPCHAQGTAATFPRMMAALAVRFAIARFRAIRSFCLFGWRPPHTFHLVSHFTPASIRFTRAQNNTFYLPRSLARASSRVRFQSICQSRLLTISYRRDFHSARLAELRHSSLRTRTHTTHAFRIQCVR